MWEGHPRTSTPAWRKLRPLILERDAGICHVCHQPGATEVDHVIPFAEGGTDDPTNLAAIHPRPCHQAKTQAEAARARQPLTNNRQPEPHPGLR